MKSSARARGNMTRQVRGQWTFLINDLKSEQAALAKAKTYQKYRLPNYSMIVKRHQRGIITTRRQLAFLKRRILRLQREGKINKIFS